MKILIADDQPEFVSSIAPILKSARCSYEHVENAVDAIQRVREAPFDLVMTDLQMPPGEWGGLDLIKAIRSFDGSIPIFVVSGKGTVVECVKAVRLGASDYILKERFLEEFPSRMDQLRAEPFAITDMPSLIGHLFRAYRDEQNSNLKLSRLIDTFEAAVRLAVCLLLSERSWCQNRPVLDVIREKSLVKPTLGVYVAVLFEILKDKPEGALQGMLSSSEIMRGRRTFDELVKARNSYSGHSSTLSPAQAEQAARGSHSGLVHVLNLLAPLRRFELMRVDTFRYDGVVFTMDGQLLRGLDLHWLPTSRQIDRPVPSGHIVLIQGNTVVADCTPLIELAIPASNIMYSYRLFDSLSGLDCRYWTVPRMEL